jgi:hypothetical protein
MNPKNCFALLALTLTALLLNGCCTARSSVANAVPGFPSLTGSGELYEVRSGAASYNTESIRQEGGWLIFEQAYPPGLQASDRKSMTIYVPLNAVDGIARRKWF